MFRIRRFIPLGLVIVCGCTPPPEAHPPERVVTFALDAAADAPMNSPPVAGDDAVEVAEDDSVTFDVLVNDVDDDGDTLTIFVSDSTNEGLLEDLGAGQFRYTPRPNFVGTDGFTYGLLDGNGGSGEAMVTIVVRGVNDPPNFVSPTPPNGALLDAVVGQVFEVSVAADDIDGDTVTISVEAADTSSLPVVDGQVLRWLPGVADLGRHDMSLIASDGLADDTRQITVTVRGAADAPCGQTVCLGGAVCFDGSCLPPCLTNADCDAAALCFDGHCARDACEHRNCDASEACVLGGCFRECTFDGECRPGERCWGSRCAETSCDDIVCADGSTCVGGTCRETCESDTACPAGACFGGGCAMDACDQVLCPAGQLCAEGACVPEADTPAEDPRFEAEGCGCGAVAEIPTGWFGVLTLAGLVLLRRAF